MAPHTDDLRIRKLEPLTPPAEVIAELPCDEAVSETVTRSRQALHEILHGRDGVMDGTGADHHRQAVVAAMQDPNPEVAGKGYAALKQSGVTVECGLMEDEARELNIGFASRMTRGRPWVRLKLAATLDGRTALENGKSQWITGPEAHRDGHRWRARACAILTGIGTVKADDPRLTVREVETPRQPLRVIVDSRLETPPAARILQGEKVLVFSAKEGSLPNAEVVRLPNPKQKVELPKMLEELARRGVNELHVEAGFRLNGSLVREGCVDEFLVYLNPSFLGDSAQGMLDLPALSDLQKRISLRALSLDRFGEDLRIVARPA